MSTTMIPGPYRLAALRAHLALSQADLARAAGLSRNTILAIERKQFCHPTTIGCVLRALNQVGFHQGFPHLSIHDLDIEIEPERLRGLRGLRQLSGIRLEAIADRAELSRAVLYKYEHGYPVTYPVAVRILVAFNALRHECDLAPVLMTQLGLRIYGFDFPEEARRTG